MLAEFTENVAKLIPEQARPPASGSDPLAAGGANQSAALQADGEQAVAPAASELKGSKILWRASFRGCGKSFSERETYNER
jgi:hypothetical protein